MSNLKYKFPTPEEMRAFEGQARAQRAAAIHNAFGATASFLGRSFKRLGR